LQWVWLQILFNSRNDFLGAVDPGVVWVVFLLPEFPSFRVALSGPFSQIFRSYQISIEGVKLCRHLCFVCCFLWFTPIEPRIPLLFFFLVVLFVMR